MLLTVGVAFRVYCDHENIEVCLHEFIDFTTRTIAVGEIATIELRPRKESLFAGSDDASLWALMRNGDEVRLIPGHYPSSSLADLVLGLREHIHSDST